jgi:hypothetical protein
MWISRCAISRLSPAAFDQGVEEFKQTIREAVEKVTKR